MKQQTNWKSDKSQYILNLIDTHTHLHFQNYNNDLEPVLERALVANISSIITIGTDQESSIQTVELTRKYPHIVFGAVGFHPTDCLDATKENFDFIENLAVGNERIIAIGEIGLDLYWKDVPLFKQLEVLEVMQNIAEKNSLPMIIHNRDALAEMKNYFTDHPLKSNNPGVMHSFAGDINDARFYLDLGFDISFTGVITFKNFKNQDVIKYIPSDRLVLETDSPFLTPHPYRGERNEPSYIPLILEILSQIKNIPTKELGEITTENAERLFKLK